MRSQYERRLKPNKSRFVHVVCQILLELFIDVLLSYLESQCTSDWKLLCGLNMQDKPTTKQCSKLPDLVQ